MGSRRLLGRRVRNQAACRSSSGLSSGSESRDRIECRDLRRRCRTVGPPAGRTELPLRASHATFHLERTYDAPVTRVWKALSDESAKQRWFGGTPGRWELLERHMDVRVGGSERLKGRWEGGVISTFDATYHDVIPNERLVYSYVMHLDDRKISVSLATMQLKAEGGQTTLKISEQGAFLDGYDDAGSREHGTGASPRCARRIAKGRSASRDTIAP
jgi:uncharacterized protein YndB with AHSA1/START domain